MHPFLVWLRLQPAFSFSKLDINFQDYRDIVSTMRRVPTGSSPATIYTFAHRHYSISAAQAFTVLHDAYLAWCEEDSVNPL